MKNLLALIGDHEARTHVSGPLGLPGGYPAIISPDGIELDLPPEINRATAVDLNTQAARWDGIERIEDDGTVIYTDRARDAMGELGLVDPDVHFDDIAEHADQLSDLYDRLTTLEGSHA